MPADLPVVVEQSTRAAGRAWLPRLPALIDAAVERWELTVGEPFRSGSAAWVAAVHRADGTEAVLKITLPHREARFEGDGLAVWAGEGAVRLLEAGDRDDYVLLIERCRPGVELQRTPMAPEERARIGGELFARLWSVDVAEDGQGLPFETVDAVAAEWAELSARRMEELRPPIDAGLVACGIGLLESLPRTATRRVLVHGDLNPGNILSADREPWLAIDAKPMVGDPGYDPWSLATQCQEWPDEGPEPSALRRHFAVVADVTGEPLERMLAWSCARSVESALWHASLDEPEQRDESMIWARAFADLAGL